MKGDAGEPFVASIPYRHRAVSSLARDGVTGVLVEVNTSDGIVGRGEVDQGYRQVGQSRPYQPDGLAREEG